MKKSTKLLSVLLAFVMALSCMTMMASAAKANYKTVAQLTMNKAYSPYGTVTRLSTEERVSILLDFLDLTLAPMQNLNMGEVVNTMGIKLTINLTSVDAIFATLDDVCNLKAGAAYAIAAVFVNLGIVEDLKITKNTDWTLNMRRSSSAQLGMINNLLKLLTNNASVIGGVLDKGIELGLISNFITGLDLKPINGLVTNIPGAINSIVLPLMSRQDDTGAQRTTLSTKTSDLMTVAQNFVNGLFTKPMSWTSYRVDASGNDLGFTTALPTGTPGSETSATKTRYFVKSADNTKITQYDYQYAGVLGDPKGGVWVETVTYSKVKEFDSADCTTYVYKAPDDFDGDQTLKWYKAEGVEDANGNIQSGYWLPSVKDAFNAGTLSLAINGSDSVAGLLYKFAPYIFDEMAPVVLNGSVKKAVAEAFNVQFTKIGNKGDANLPTDEFFTKAQEYYTWEYSDYAVIDGVHYYRFQDEFFQGEIPTDISDYFYMVNWDYHMPKGFMNKYIPATVGGTSAAGYTHVLDALNVFVKDVIDLFIADSWTVNNKTYTRDGVFKWTAGGNDKLIDNLITVARNVFSIAPEQIVDEYVTESQFYDAMMTGTKFQAVNGLVCELVKLIMPQIKFADNIVDQPITAIAAVVVRELCTQLMPKYDFDAMLFADYNNRTMLTGKSADYWLDTTLYMGLNLGMYYLRNIADLGEDDTTNGYFAVMSNLGALPTLTIDSANPTAAADAITFGANAQYVGGTASWLYMVDWIIDWALASNVEWAWQFEKFIDCGSTVDLTTYQNPFNKLDTILLGLLPVDQLLNASGLAGTTYGSGTFVEKILKDGLVDSIVTLDLDKLQGCLEVPTGYFTQGNIADSLVKIVVKLLDKVLYKVAGNTNIINQVKINSVAALLNHANIKEVVVTLIGKLRAASETYNVLQPVMPILNFFVGWTTDPQKYADPQIYFTNDWNSSYLKSDNNPVIKVTNTSSGMLLKHRNSSKTDTAYSIQITGITLDGGVSTTQTFPVTVQPGDTADIALNVPTTSTVTKATITYKFTGKDGTALGGDQTQVSYAYVSSEKDQINEKWPAADVDYYEKAETNKYIFARDIYEAVTNFSVTINYKGSLFSNPSRNFNFVKWKTAAPAPFATYFELITNRDEGNWAATLSKNGTTSTTPKLFKAKTGVTAEQFTEEFAEANNLYGVWDGGSVFYKYGTNNNKNDYIDIDIIYYNDYNIGKVKDQYVGYALQAKDFDDAALFNAYETALKKVVSLADVAMTTEYVTKVQPQIKTAITALEDAYNALMANGSSSSSSTGDIQIVKDALAGIETRDNGEDWNFQDHNLFEYFKYEDQRNHAREMIANTTAPSAPTNRIENEDYSEDLIQAVIAAQTNAKVAEGIDATVIEPSNEDMTNYLNALANYKPANYTELECLDQAAKLDYYFSFMRDNEKTTDKTFLNREIAYAVAQDYDQADYSIDSWARYTKALAAAQAAAANADIEESKVFDAKYELMVAQNELKLQERSMKESGYMNEELIPLINHANAILDNFGSIYSVVDGMTEADAFAQLVKALGVAYDVTVDGKDYEGILYSRSALTFKEYDRTLTAKNKRAVDATADKLRAAIENFEANAKLTSKDTTVTKVDQTIRFIQGIIPGTIKSSAQLLDRVTVTGGDAITTASKAGNYGTGARVDIKKNDILLATYFVVIYGDVNGDGAVDAFDAIEVDMANSTAYYMGDVYDDAADLTNDGKVDTSDYAALVAGITCVGAINQNPTNA